MTFDQAVELLREKVPVALAWIGARFGNTCWYIEYRRDDEDAPCAFFEIHTFADGITRIWTPLRIIRFLIVSFSAPVISP